MTLPANEWTDEWADACVRFGPFQLYPQQRVLLEHGRPLKLGSRAFDILVTLAGQAGTTVTKAELLARVWPDTVVEEANLRVHVAALRKALRDPVGQRYIDSVAGRGYTFVAAVVHDAWPAAASGPVPPAGPLVGRPESVAALARRVLENRLVTVTGTGGVGKSALALTVAQRLAARLPCHCIDLADTNVGNGTDHGNGADHGADASTVAAALARGLGLAPCPSPLAAVLAHLRQRPLLLLLDNCERRIDAVALLAEQLLQALPQLRILATSREALRATGERVHLLAPLDCPPADAGAATVMASPAVTLFLRRAALDGAALAAADSAAVADICRRLDGVPLALELAAARLDLFHVRELAARLAAQPDAPLHLLKGGRRTAPPRHRSLRASLEWSWATLAPVERAVLQRLALLPGEFGLAAAVRVAAGAVTDAAGVEDAVAALHAKSLLVARQDATGLRCRLTVGARAHALALAAAQRPALVPPRCAAARPALPARPPLARGGVTTRTA